MKNLTDPQPTIVRQVLNNDSKLQEILWNFSRFDHERRLTLSQNPHFYDHLPTSPNANWSEFDSQATEENWPTNHTQPIYVLTNIPGRVFLELGPNPRAFDNVWNTNGALIFKSVCGKLEGEGIVGTSVQHHLYSWCHVEHLPSGPGVQPTMVQSDTGTPPEMMRSTTSPLTCVLVTGWKDALREALHSPHVKIRIKICTEPARGCVGPAWGGLNAP